MNLKKTFDLKNKFKSRDLVFGGWLSYPDISIIETFSNADFDFFGIDVEHTTISKDQLKSLIISSQSYSKVCLPRPGSIDLNFIKPILDAGADGLILPMIENESDCILANQFIKFPPMGERSYGVNRAHSYGFKFDQYISDWNDSSITIYQIESIKGVNNLEIILQNNPPDAVMIGPYDLSASIGCPGDFESELFVSSQRKIIDICNEYKISCGIQINEISNKLVEDKVKMGF